MTMLIISILVFLILGSIVTTLLFKTKSLKKYNVFIYISLFIFWTVMQLFKMNTNNMISDIVLKPWVWPLIISLYQFTQVLIRIPFGILSSKMKSRKLIIQISASFFILTGMTLIISNFAFWSIVLTMIGAGVVGSTFGLDSQYWSENWNIKKVFYSSVIMFTIPVLTSSLGNVMKQITIFNSGVSLEIIKWIFISGLIVEVIYAGIYTSIKENKETIGLDLGATKDVLHDSKGYSLIWKLSITASLIAFVTIMLTNSFVMNNMGINSKDIIEGIISITMVASILMAIATGTYLVRIFDISKIKIFSLITMLISCILGFILALTKVHAPIIWILDSIVISLSAVVFQVTLFGSTLHLDHKHPALVLGIFLSIRSFALGSGELISRELIVNLNTINIALPIIFSIAIALCISTIVFYGINKKEMNNFYKKIQSYEFNLISSKLVVSKKIVKK